MVKIYFHRLNAATLVVYDANCYIEKSWLPLTSQVAGRRFSPKHSHRRRPTFIHYSLFVSQLKLLCRWFSIFPTTMQKERLLKVLVVGDLGVGKTAIIRRYVQQVFSRHYRATIGVDFALKVVPWDPLTVLRLQLWDIAGKLHIHIHDQHLLYSNEFTRTLWRHFEVKRAASAYYIQIVQKSDVTYTYFWCYFIVPVLYELYLNLYT